MSQALIEALDALESQVAALSGAVKAADPTEIGKKAEDGARRGASAAVSGLREITLSLQETARGLDDATRALRKYALPAAQRAREAEQRRRWWKTCPDGPNRAPGASKRLYGGCGRDPLRLDHGHRDWLPLPRRKVDSNGGYGERS